MQLHEYLARTEGENGQTGATLQDFGPVTSATQLSETGYFNPRPNPRNPQYQRNYDGMRNLVEKAQSGDRWALYRLQEAMTISDFSGYFGDVLNRAVLANYSETPYSWSQYLHRDELNDMRIKKLFRFDRGAQPLDGPIVPTSTGPLDGSSGSTGLEEFTEYPMRRRVQSNYQDQLYKFGARFGFSFEVFLGDDLNALKDTPALLGRAARRTEESRATKLYTSSTGPNATFFNATTNKNLVSNANSDYAFVTTNNPILSIVSLQWALTILAMQKDLDGQPISIEGAVLVVPPALKYAAYNITRASQIAMNSQGGTISSGNASEQRLYAPNQFQGAVDVAVNYYAPIVNTTSGNTAWYVFANPNDGRPAAQLSFLRGRNAPQIFMRASNQVLIGESTTGGATSMVNPMEGDFENDSIDYKERHFIGGTLLDPIMAVASSGAGS
jgi:hypothetical protein